MTQLDIRRILKESSEPLNLRQIETITGIGIRTLGNAIAKMDDIIKDTGVNDRGQVVLYYSMK